MSALENKNVVSMDVDPDNETDEKTNVNDFSKLPPHVITNILSFLPVFQIIKMATVCRTWHEASLSVEITNKIAVHMFGNRDVKHFLDIKNNVRSFGSIYFSGTNFSQLDYGRFLFKYSSNIRHVEFIDCYMELNQLLECLEILNKLESIKIQTNNNSNLIVDHSVNITDVLKQNLSRIKKLSIQCHDVETFLSVNLILSKCINLESLTYVIPMLRNDFDDGSQIYGSLIIAMDQWYRVDLKYLSIENQGSISSDVFFTSFQTLNVIRINKLNLRNIRTTYEPESFDQFCAGMYDIRDLDVDIRTHSNLSFICKNLTNLRRLSINAMPTKNIGIIEDLHNLEVLEVATFDVPQEDLLKICNAEMPNLRKLCLNIMILNKICLVALCNNFKKLDHLNVSLNTKCFYPIFKNLHNLKHLTIYLAENADDEQFNEEDCNILALQKLERLYVEVLVPGITTEQIALLPNLKFYRCMANELTWINKRIVN